MKSFDSFVKKTNGTSFLSMQQTERENTLSDLLNIKTDDSDPLQKDIFLFVSTVKGLTSYGYMQSEYIMKEVMPYTLIPGSYGPCETVDKSKRINVNG